MLTGVPSLYYSHSCPRLTSHSPKTLPPLYSIFLEAGAHNYPIAACCPKSKEKGIDPLTAPSNSFSVLQILEGPTTASGISQTELVRRKMENLHLLLHNPYLTYRAFQKMYSIKDSNSQVRKFTKAALSEMIDNNAAGQLLVWVSYREYTAKFKGTVVN